MARVRLKHEALVECLQEKSISQNRWAQILGLSSAHLSMLANGKRPYPDAETRSKLLKGLSAHFDELFEIEGEAGSDPRPSVHGRPWGGRASSPGSRKKAHIMSSFWQDLRFTLRGWVRRPGFVGAALLVLALAICANTAIFSVVSEVLLRPLPFPQPGKIVVVSNYAPDSGFAVGMSAEEFHLYQERQEVFQAFAAFRQRAVNLSGDGHPRQVSVLEASPEFFRVLETEAALGRVFQPDAEGLLDERIVLLTHGLWQSDFAGDPAVVGRTVRLDERRFEVIGVLPPEFEAVELSVELVRPLLIRPENLEPADFHNHNLSAWARLPEDWQLARAEDALEAMMVGLRDELPGDFKRGDGHSALRLDPLLEMMVGPVRPALMLMLWAVAAVLLIACANVAHLFLTRAKGRRREFALRSVLGAGRGQLTRQLLTECLLLALLAGAAGLVLSLWVTDLLLAGAPTGLPRLQEVSLGWGVLAFNLLVSLGAGVVFGMAPVFSLRRGRWAAALRGGDRVAGQSGARRLSGGRLLAASETALSLVLLLAAVLLIASLGRLLGVDPGFQPANVTVAQLSLPDGGYPDDAQTRAFAHRLQQEVRSLPGVGQAALSFRLPLTGSNNWAFEIQGREQEGVSLAQYNLVSSSYFETLGIPLVAGRTFLDESDAEQPVVILSRSTAQRLWPDRNPLGKRINVDIEERVWREVVGVVGDVKTVNLSREGELQMYFPLQRFSFALPNNLWLSVRSAGGTVSTASLRALLQRIDPSVPLTSPDTLQSLIDSQLRRPRFLAWLLSLFALTALVMAGTGLYGVMSYSVEERKREFGVRLALGATRGRVASAVLRATAATAGLGILAGLLLSLSLSRVLESLLYGVSPTDATTYAVAASGLLILALASVWIPCLRATRVDPAQTLRAQ